MTAALRLALSGVSALFALVPGVLWAALVAAALMHGCWIDHQRDAVTRDLAQLQDRVDQENAARALAASTANANFRKYEHQQAAAAAEIEDANQTRKAAAAGVDSSNRAAVDGLRRDIARLDTAARSRGVPSAGACPAELEASRRAAETARGLLGACAAEYRGLGSDAERDAIDLDTGLSYIDLVHTSVPQ